MKLNRICFEDINFFTCFSVRSKSWAIHSTRMKDFERVLKMPLGLTAFCTLSLISHSKKYENFSATVSLSLVTTWKIVSTPPPTQLLHRTELTQIRNISFCCHTVTSTQLHIQEMLHTDEHSGSRERDGGISWKELSDKFYLNND